MTDEELIRELRNSKDWPNLGNAAADLIEHLEIDRDGWIANAYAAVDWQRDAEYKLEIAEAKLAKAVEALRFYADCPIHSVRREALYVLEELKQTE